MVSNKMNDLIGKSSLIRAMFEEGKRLSKIHGKENVYDFSLGNPNVAPPESIKQSIIDIVNEEEPTMVHGYMSNAGYEDVRNKIAEYENRTKGINITGENVIMTCGAAGGLNIIFKSILNPGDEILTFAPFFAEYNNYASNFDAVLKVVPPDTETFQPNLEIFADMITEKTKIVLINTPNNPSGVIYKEDAIIKLCDILREKEKETGVKITLVSDEPYREIVYDDVEIPYILNYYDHSIVGYSYSKALSLAGERIGYIVVNPKNDDYANLMMALVTANRILGFVNAPSLIQRVVADNLDTVVDISYYKNNRDALYNSLTELGYECVYPDGAFYLFVKSPIEDDMQFCEDAKKFNLLLVPGKIFGCPSYVRLSYCIANETIMNSIKAFEELIKLYK